MTDTMTILDRFMSHVRKIETGCWIWTGSLNAEGYGTFKDGKKTWLAHRWAYKHIGKHDLVPELHHKCRVRACVNHKDLEPTDPLTHPDKPSVLNLLKKECPAGHPYDEVNTYVDSRGHRHCRECRKEANMRSYWKRWKKVRKAQKEYHAHNKERINSRRRVS